MVAFPVSLKSSPITSIIFNCKLAALFAVLLAPLSLSSCAVLTRDFPICSLWHDIRWLRISVSQILPNETNCIAPRLRWILKSLRSIYIQNNFTIWRIYNKQGNKYTLKQSRQHNRGTSGKRGPLVTQTNLLTRSAPSLSDYTTHTHKRWLYCAAVQMLAHKSFCDWYYKSFLWVRSVLCLTLWIITNGTHHKLKVSAVIFRFLRCFSVALN